MTLHLPDDIVRQSGLTDDQLRVELACRLFDGGRLALWPAAQLAGLSRIEFESELRKRSIPLHRPTPEDLQNDLQTLDRLGA